MSAATLPQDGEDFTGRSGNVTGWGSNAMGGDNADVVHLVTVPILQDSGTRSSLGLIEELDSIALDLLYSSQ